MNGRVFVLALLAVVALFAIGLWYALVYAWYEEVEGLERVTVAGVETPVTAYRGLDGASPLKLRGCFTLDPAPLADLPDATGPTPLVSPGWFDCFDAEALEAALAAGDARAVIAEVNEAPGFDRLIAYFPDGRAFQWRQTNGTLGE